MTPALRALADLVDALDHYLPWEKRAERAKVLKAIARAREVLAATGDMPTCDTRTDDGAVCDLARGHGPVHQGWRFGIRYEWTNPPVPSPSPRAPPAEDRCLLCGGSIDGHGHPPREWDAALNSGLPNRAPPAASVPEEPLPEEIERLINRLESLQYTYGEEDGRDLSYKRLLRDEERCKRTRADLEAAILAALRRARSGR